MRGDERSHIEDISARESTTNVRPAQLTRKMMMRPPVCPFAIAVAVVLDLQSALGLSDILAFIHEGFD